MATYTFLDDPADMEWLHDEHFPSYSDLDGFIARFHSAEVIGHEDCPMEIHLYESASPRVDDPYVRFRREEDGELHQADRYDPPFYG